MNKKQVSEIQHGLYEIFWKEGGSSLASVGSDRNGKRWYAPINWIVVPWYDWRCVLRVRQICPTTRALDADCTHAYTHDTQPVDYRFCPWCGGEHHPRQ
jgi:hypothetical protein